MKALHLQDLSLFLEEEGESSDIIMNQGIIDTTPILSCGNSQDDEEEEDYEDDDDDYYDDYPWVCEDDEDYNPWGRIPSESAPIK